ncbi:hypothetical protein TNCV_2733471 [Trichonephila clavipes]|nr:hypothetical protein TNCV_2733471 [Trichonephila clavipes]
MHLAGVRTYAPLKVRLQRWGKTTHSFHKIPFPVNRANVKIAVVTLGTGDLPSDSMPPALPLSGGAQVFEWYKRFSEERVSAEEDEPAGWPRSAITDQKMSKIRDMNGILLTSVAIQLINTTTMKY